MDGARFANAVAALDCAPKAITWEAGVASLCFGGTRTGLLPVSWSFFTEGAGARDLITGRSKRDSLLRKCAFLRRHGRTVE
jgi:threonine aldolase